MRKLLLALVFVFLFASNISFAWLSGYTYKATVTLNSTVATNQTNFPVQVVLNTTTLISAGKMQADCDDIRVTNSSDTVLNYEIEKCNATNTVVWVKIPNLLDKTSLTTIWVYYGNATVSSGQNATGVWSNGYKSVYHFTTQNDSLGVGWTLTNITTKSTGCIYGDCYDLGMNNSGYIPDIFPFGASVWVKDTNQTVRNIPFGSYTATYRGGFGFDFTRVSANTYFWDWNGGTSKLVTGTGTLVNNTWNFFAGITRSDTDREVYLNGTSTGTATGSGGSTKPTYNMCIGSGSYTSVCSSFPFYGDMDELRFHNITRTSDWFLAEYGQTYTLGGEYSEGGVLATLANASETENKTIYATIDLPIYNLTAYYNNTLVANLTSQTLSTQNISVVAPLVQTNLTIIEWNVTVSSATTLSSTAGNQTVYLWYYPSAYNYSIAAVTTEAASNITVTPPSIPPAAPLTPDYPSYSHAPDHHEKIYANGTTANITGNSSYIVDGALNFTILPTHLSENGLISLDHWINNTYALSYGPTAESVSNKTISDLRNITRAYFVWLTNSTNGSINGSSNMSDLYNITFYDDVSLAPLNIDSVSNEYAVFFPDSTNKTFSIAYTSAVSSARVRDYPNSYTVNISGNEMYTKEGFSTRNKFFFWNTVPLGTQQNISVYLLNMSSPSAQYALINIINRGAAVSSAYVQIMKYYGSSGTYINIDQKITNNQGQAGGYYTTESYYKFGVYDSGGNQLYYSSGPEHFVLRNGNYQITIDVANTTALDFITPYVEASCTGNNSTNSIIYSYIDYTGQTHTINFLAWRSSNTTLYGTPVCNSTITGSSGAYTCTLSSPENLSNYLYTCVVRKSASPTMDVIINLLDFKVYSGLFDWGIIALLAISGFSAIGIMVNPAAGIVVTTIVVFVLTITGYFALTTAGAVYLVIVGAVITYLMLR